MTEKKKLLALAKKTAKKIRKRTSIPGWHADESKFPECDFDDIVAMLEEAIATEPGNQH